MDLSIRCFDNPRHVLLIFVGAVPILVIYVFAAPVLIFRATRSQFSLTQQVTQAITSDMDEENQRLRERISTLTNWIETTGAVVPNVECSTSRATHSNRSKIHPASEPVADLDTTHQARTIDAEIPSARYLVEQKTQLQWFQHRYGFLLIGYRPELAWWECVIMFRKVLLSAIAVSFWGNISTQIELGMLVMVGSLILQSSQRPFIRKSMNRFEQYALFTVFINFFLGQYALSDSFRTETVELASILGLMTNVVFLFVSLCVIIYQLWKDKQDRISKKTQKNRLKQQEHDDTDSATGSDAANTVKIELAKHRD